MTDDFERYYELTIPRDHSLAQMETNDQDRYSDDFAFKTKAALQLREIFGKNVFFLKEIQGVGGNGKRRSRNEGADDRGGSPTQLTLSYQVALQLHQEKEKEAKEAKMADFRQKVEELGFSVRPISSAEARR